MPIFNAFQFSLYLWHISLVLKTFNMSLFTELPINFACSVEKDGQKVCPALVLHAVHRIWMLDLCRQLLSQRWLQHHPRGPQLVSWRCLWHPTLWSAAAQATLWQSEPAALMTPLAGSPAINCLCRCAALLPILCLSRVASLATRQADLATTSCLPNLHDCKRLAPG